MNRLYRYILLLVAACCFIWFQAEPNFFSYDNFMQWRSALIQATGIISLLLLTITMLLALRLPFVEKLTAGLDKSYRLHKWTAIYGVVIGVVHWLLAIVPKKLVALGIFERGNHTRPEFDADSLQAIVMSLRGGAESVGELSLYLFIALTLIALFAPIKYKRFRITHKLMALIFVVIAYHSVVLIKPAYWDNLITPVVVCLAIAGVVSAVMSLLGLIGKRRTFQGSVEQIEQDQFNQTTKVQIALPRWQGHKAGQFAFLKVAGEEPHPFTITSSSQAPLVEFTIKALGDFTSILHQQLKVGDQVEVEGPYGDFKFDDDKPQIWIAGGIGCAAFKARLAELKLNNDHAPVTFFYCTQAPSPSLIREFELAAAEANIEFHVIDNRLMSFLTIDEIKRRKGDLSNASIWFCGPTGFGESLKDQLKLQRFNLAHFHNELFNFR